MSLQLCRDYCASRRKSLFADAAAVEFEGDSADTLLVTLTPKDGPFGGCKVEFTMEFEDYGNKAPKVRCLTDIYHPNVESVEGGGDICLNVLDEDFDTSLKLEHFVNALLFLLYEPCVEDPLTDMDTCDLEEYLENLKLAVKGDFTNECSGHSYSSILVDGGEDENPEFAEVEVTETPVFLQSVAFFRVVLEEALSPPLSSVPTQLRTSTGIEFVREEVAGRGMLASSAGLVS